MPVPAPDVDVVAGVKVRMTDRHEDRVAGVTAADAAQHHSVGIPRRESRAGKHGNGGETEDQLAGHGFLLRQGVAIAIGRRGRQKVHGSPARAV